MGKPVGNTLKPAADHEAVGRPMRNAILLLLIGVVVGLIAIAASKGAHAGPVTSGDGPALVSAAGQAR